MESSSTPNGVMELLAPASFVHKNWRVRQLALECFEAATARSITMAPWLISRFGTAGLTPLKFLPSVARLLGDQNEHVREQAVGTVLEFYRVVGERVRVELSRSDGGP